MNYRHIYHAGNFADVVKHATLARIIVYLTNKPAPFRVIDTHAGIGLYDLAADEAERTGEWRDGIGRVLADPAPAEIAELLKPYFAVLSAVNADGDLLAYPGSPELARHLTRKSDRLTLVEKHPRDFETLAALYAGNRRVKCIELDGWLALGAFLPPKEKRGLVLIDPAFEDSAEFDNLANGLIAGHKRWPTGIYCAWYPLKNEKAVARFTAKLAKAGIRNILKVDFAVARPDADGPLAASGLLVINPPWTLADELHAMLPWLLERMKRGPGAYASVDQLVPE
ncbi:MAG: 23S rRNA (adenine(2030)-N(6))-methyltransferase RlmJ [Hyphomicrobiales bacterium]|nr:MAG: 23S rRNA (adenine(2030)-N(6))-methyltransferase RlmJ [Hyphomicrobiales bacterium]